jgi:hypothetical protein
MGFITSIPLSLISLIPLNIFIKLFQENREHSELIHRKEYGEDGLQRLLEAVKESSETVVQWPVQVH